MASIRPNAEPAATSVAGGDIFLIDGATGVRALAATAVPKVAAGKVCTVNNSLTLAGTDATTMTFPATSATLARTDAANTFTGTQTVGALVATTLNGNTFTAGTGILTLAALKTLTVNNSLTLAGTDSTTMTFPSTTGAVQTADSTGTFTNKTFNTAATGNVFQINGVGITANTGTGSNVLATSPALTTPAISGGTIDNAVIGGTTPAAGTFTAVTTSQYFRVPIPLTVTTNYTMLSTDSAIIFNSAGTMTLTFQSAASFPGRILYLKNISPQIVNSASSNVVPIGTATPGTAIFAAAAGKFVTIISDGTNWIVMAGN